jgi:hypothetical protein
MQVISSENTHPNIQKCVGPKMGGHERRARPEGVEEAATISTTAAGLGVGLPLLLVGSRLLVGLAAAAAAASFSVRATGRVGGCWGRGREKFKAVYQRVQIVGLLLLMLVGGGQRWWLAGSANGRTFLEGSPLETNIIKNKIN